MTKIFTITFKELRDTFRDRTLLVLMFVLPFSIATIIALTFGSLVGDDAPVSNIPVALVNLDPSGENSAAHIFADILLATGEPSADQAETPTSPVCPSDSGSASSDTALGDTQTTSLDTLLNTTQFDSVEAAKAAVNNASYVAAVIIPPDFSTNLTYSATKPRIDPTQIEIYADPRFPIAASIVRGVVEGILTQLGAGNIAIAATLDTVIADYGALRLVAVTTSPSFNANVACAFAGASAVIRLNAQDVGGGESDFNPLVLFGASQAIFFALFTANGFAASILEERRNWTLQRLMISPTPRTTVLMGKLFSTFSQVVVQLAFLAGAFTVVASLLAGELQFIWGTNVIGILLMLIASSLAAAGLGSIIAGFARTAEQANIVGTVISLFMAILGGGFGFTLPMPLPYASVIYWGSNGFTKLASGQGDYGLNVTVLMIFGIVTFSIGALLFNRRIAE